MPIDVTRSVNALPPPPSTPPDPNLGYAVGVLQNYQSEVPSRPGFALPGSFRPPLVAGGPGSVFTCYHKYTCDPATWYRRMLREMGRDISPWSGASEKPAGWGSTDPDSVSLQIIGHSAGAVPEKEDPHTGLTHVEPYAEAVRSPHETAFGQSPHP